MKHRPFLLILTILAACAAMLFSVSSAFSDVSLNEQIEDVYEEVTYQFSGTIEEGGFWTYQLKLDKPVRYSNMYDTVVHEGIMFPASDNWWIENGYLGQDVVIEGEVLGYRGTPDELIFSWFNIISPVIDVGDPADHPHIEYVPLYYDIVCDVESGERYHYISDPVYDDFGYTLCDLDGDGIMELILKQVTSKHGGHYWVYTSDGNDAWYMGEFDDDNLFVIGGYKTGIIYEYEYKGLYQINAQVWNGSSFDRQTLYEELYDREGEPPTLESASAYIDTSRITGWAPEFSATNDITLLQNGGVIGSNNV